MVSNGSVVRKLKKVAIITIGVLVVCLLCSADSAIRSNVLDDSPKHIASGVVVGTQLASLSPSETRVLDAPFVEPDLDEGLDVFADIWDKEGFPSDDDDDAFADVGDADGDAPKTGQPTTSPTPKNPSGKKPSDASAAPTPAPSSEFPYLIYVSKNSYTIAILGLDDNMEYTKILRTFATGIGRSGAQTRAGTYTITEKEPWHTWSKNAHSPYATKHSGGLWFHGPSFKEKNYNTLISDSYNGIGTAVSSGCLRTTCSAAAWIYYNCALGTPVIIANDSKYTSKPFEKIPDGQTYDPTHPGSKQEIPITSFALVRDDVGLTVGQTFQVSVKKVLPEDTTTTKYIYSSSDVSVATVDSSGQIEAVGEGTCVIHVKANDVGTVTRSLIVTVEPAISKYQRDDSPDQDDGGQTQGLPQDGADADDGPSDAPSDG
jgi:lipoprotein-anchoring transpeptidase ErfK/SrfK